MQMSAVSAGPPGRCVGCGDKVREKLEMSTSFYGSDSTDRNRQKDTAPGQLPEKRIDQISPVSFAARSICNNRSDRLPVMPTDSRTSPGDNPIFL
jgi:hypothetical protein